MVSADIIWFCAILQLGIRAYFLPIEHVHFPGPSGLAAVILIWVNCTINEKIQRLASFTAHMPQICWHMLPVD
jgi:hypothetical protein